MWEVFIALETDEGFGYAVSLPVSDELFVVGEGLTTVTTCGSLPLVGGFH